MNPAKKKHLTSPRAKNSLDLPGFKFPSEDETDTDANERSLFRLLLHIVTCVALQIAEYTPFCFASGLSHGIFRLTLGVLPNTILSGG